MIKKYPALVIQHDKLIDNIYTLVFKSLKRAFKFNPGQFLHVAIDEYDGVGQWPESRCFSMQSAPGENTLQITYATKGTFTKRMATELKVGSRVWLKMPYGTIFDEAPIKGKAIFIAGGTGITPFLSLFRHTDFTEYNHPVLFIGIREKKYHLYKKEIEAAKIINPSFAVLTYIENENGRPDLDTILQQKGNTFFISGPPEMISFYKNELIKKDIKNEQIITDDWE